LAQLQSEALGEVAREDTGRIETLQPRQNRCEARRLAAENGRGGGEFVAEIAGVVDEVDEIGANQAVGGIAELQPELRDEMIAQRGGARGTLSEAGRSVAAAL